MLTSGGTGRQPGDVGSRGVANRGGGAVTACVAVTAVALLVLHVDGVGAVDPVVQTISDYASLPGGYALLGVAAVALAVAAGLLAAGLRGSGLADPAAPAALLAVAGGGLVAAAVFPTNYPGTPAGVIANLHRVAGAVVLVTLPLAAWMIARRAVRTPSWRASAPSLSWIGTATCTASAVFLLSNIPIVITGSPILTALGALQRVLYAVVMLALVMLARAARVAAVAVGTAPQLVAGVVHVEGRLGGTA